MNIHEYQAKEILKKYGVATPRGKVASTPAEAQGAAKELGDGLRVVKAQIHAGGRGKGKFKEEKAAGIGGVVLAKSEEEVWAAAEKMLGATLVTNQTGAEGRVVRKVYVEEGTQIDRELYLSALIDRATSRITFMASAEGGMNIEEVAAKHPEKIIFVSVDPAAGIQDFHARKLGFALGMTKEQHAPFTKFILALYRAFCDTDASQIEINPLCVTKSGDIIALDAKINFDENALFRHPDIAAMRDEEEEDPLEREAAKHSLSYIKLDGNIGCMVNGAGLAMATMDIIKLSGGAPANFLDVGGGATRERVTEAFKLITSDPNVEGILVNIFGGIMRCDIIAEGIITASREVGLNVPLVVRLEGTNVELGKKMMASSGLPIIPADNLGEAAEKIVSAIKKAAA